MGQHGAACGIERDEGTQTVGCPASVA